MNYTKIQFIGYDINTSPKNATFQNKFLKSGKYVGLKDPEEDIKARVKLIQEVINNAKEKASKDSTTLKIFMTPEFFFRGAKGAYEMDHAQDLITQLQESVKSEDWKDWLFVFGSIVAFSERIDDGFEKLFGETPPFEVYNIVLAQKGGFANADPKTESENMEKGARVIMKEFKSNIDFIMDPNSGIGLRWGTVSPIGSNGPRGYGKEQQVVNYDGLGIFEIDDICFGLEVCLDHALNRLQRSPQMPNDQRIQVHLIPSCGMSIRDYSVVAGNKGFAFNVDGLRPSVTLKEVVDLEKHALSNPYRPAVTIDVNFQSASPPVSINDLFAYGAGEIIIYGEEPLPKPEKIIGQTNVKEFGSLSDRFMLRYELVYNQEVVFEKALCQIYFKDINRWSNEFTLPINFSIEGSDSTLPFTIQSHTKGANFIGTSDDMGVYLNFMDGEDHAQGIIFTFPSKKKPA